MIDHGRSKTRQFCRTFTCLRYGPQAGLRLLSLFLSSVGKISRLYGAKSTLVSTVGRECCMSGSSVSTHEKSFEMFALWLLSEIGLPANSIS